MKFEDLNTLNKNELLDLYTLMVKVDHYDPFETPAKAVELSKNGISAGDLESLILKRMSE